MDCRSSGGDSIIHIAIQCLIKEFKRIRKRKKKEVARVLTDTRKKKDSGDRSSS